VNGLLYGIKEVHCLATSQNYFILIQYQVPILNMDSSRGQNIGSNSHMLCTCNSNMLLLC